MNGHIYTTLNRLFIWFEFDDTFYRNNLDYQNFFLVFSCLGKIDDEIDFSCECVPINNLIIIIIIFNEEEEKTNVNKGHNCCFSYL